MATYGIARTQAFSVSTYTHYNRINHNGTFPAKRVTGQNYYKITTTIQYRSVMHYIAP